MDKKLVSVGLASLVLGGLMGGCVAKSHLEKPYYYNDFDSFHSMMMQDTFRTIDSMQKDFERLEGLFEKQHKYVMKNVSQNADGLKMSVKKDSQKSVYEVNLELPQDFDAKNIKTEIDKHLITIKGDFQNQKQADSRYYYSGSNFYKSFNIQEEIECDKVSRQVDKNKMIIKIPYKSKPSI